MKGIKSILPPFCVFVVLSLLSGAMQYSTEEQRSAVSMAVCLVSTARPPLTAVTIRPTATRGTTASRMSLRLRPPSLPTEQRPPRVRRLVTKTPAPERSCDQTGSSWKKKKLLKEDRPPADTHVVSSVYSVKVENTTSVSCAASSADDLLAVRPTAEQEFGNKLVSRF